MRLKFLGKYSNILGFMAILKDWDLLALVKLYLHLFANYLHTNIIFLKINCQFLPIYLVFNQVNLVQVKNYIMVWDAKDYLWDWDGTWLSLKQERLMSL